MISNPVGAAIVIVGACVYPEPPVTSTSVTTPFTTVAVAEPPLPPPSDTVTVGTLE